MRGGDAGPSAPLKRIRAVQIGGGLLVAGVGFWQLARVGFDWRAVLEGADPVFFFFAMATLPVFGFPISVCYLYAGAAFGPWMASGLCLAALAVNLSASYGLAHSVLKGPLVRLMERRGWRVPTLRGENVFRFAFLVRTVPGPPFFFQNLALSLAGIPFWTYLWISLLAQGGIAVGVVLCVGALARDPGSVGGVVALVVVGLLLVVMLVRWGVRRRAAPPSRQEA